MKFRIAELDDLEMLNKISLQSKAYWGYPESWIAHWSDELKLDRDKFLNQNVLVVENESKILGFCSIVENSENYEILHLWMLPEHIGKGIGRNLLTETIETFVKIEKPIIVEADPNAEPFYKRQGFVTYDRVESYPKGRYLPVMKKSIGHNS